MLSYQHGFHAGNMADVHKHSLLAWMLDYMIRKDKPLTYLETHAGRGLYDTTDAMALKTGEAAQGIKIAEKWFPKDHPYLRALAAVRADHGPNAYPGSPLIAAHVLRSTDPIVLSELHPQEFAALKDTMAPHHVTCAQQDGFEMALSRCPPDPRRGIMLIDPSFEIKTDYETIPGTIAKVHRKWGVGVIALWYPILTDGRHTQMIAELCSTVANVFVHEVRFPPARQGHGMVGSGMAIINAPYGIADQAAWLTKRFASLR